MYKISLEIDTEQMLRYLILAHSGDKVTLLQKIADTTVVELITELDRSCLT